MNAAARLVFQSSRYDHVTPLLHRLHWLRAPERISYKLAVWSSSALMDLGRSNWYPTASCWNTRPTMPTVIVNLGFGCTSDMASYWRRPVVSCRGSTNMEQFASWSDVVNFPSNLKSKLKSHLFSAWGLLPFLNLLDCKLNFVKWLKCFAFSHYNPNVM